ncbi:MAG: hypothetical protein KIH00_06575 [Lachnospiraceae bacterium]|nr:hypothetical protein [Lachnospiraceae bacterium]
MKELDFLFLYEHKVRELENLCLIKYELDKRGYRTEIRYIEDAENALAVKPFIHTKVLLVMACYNNQTLDWQTKNFVKFDKVIDMQWENIVYPKDEDRKDAYKNYTEIGKDVVRVSWGKQNQKRMLDVVKMPPEKLKLTGHVGMDFLRQPLSRYYMSRQELFEKYDLPMDKKVVLFASPYYGDSLDEAYIRDMCMRFGDDWADYYTFMCESQRQVLTWMEEILKADDEICFIYRPHPGHPTKCAQELAEKYSNFKIISGESVKQWIVTCDKVYTGNSSVVVEAFFAKKMCQLLFPLPVTEGFELKLISDSDKITDFEGFQASLYATDEKFPTPEESIEEIYLIDWEEPSYIKFANMAEEVLSNDSYRLSREQLKGYKPTYTGVTGLIKSLSRCDLLYKPYLKMLENDRLKWSFLERQRQIREGAYRIEQEHSHELTSAREIEEIINRIANALEQ